MAVVDTITGQIIGCKPGTLTYQHEKGHLVYNRSEEGIRKSYWAGQMLYITIGFLVLHMVIPFIVFKVGAVVCLVVFSWLMIYEELWCWFYALSSLKNGKAKRNKAIKKRKV